MRSTAAMKACSVGRRAFGDDGYLTKRSAGKLPEVAIVQGYVAADAIVGTGDMKAV
jgi:hypothetical protein